VAVPPPVEAPVVSLGEVPVAVPVEGEEEGEVGLQLVSRLPQRVHPRHCQRAHPMPQPSAVGPHHPMRIAADSPPGSPSGDPGGLLRRSPEGLLCRSPERLLCRSPWGPLDGGPDLSTISASTAGQRGGTESSGRAK